MTQETTGTLRYLRPSWLRPPQPAVHFEPPPSDVLAQCPKCKTMETLQFVGDLLTPSRKFRQRDGLVYHDCGSERPCRLHRQSAATRTAGRGARW